jgi:hypothetical protein
MRTTSRLSSLLKGESYFCKRCQGLLKMCWNNSNSIKFVYNGYSVQPLCYFVYFLLNFLYHLLTVERMLENAMELLKSIVLSAELEIGSLGMYGKWDKPLIESYNYIKLSLLAFLFKIFISYGHTRSGH